MGSREKVEDFFYFGLFGAAEGVLFGEFGLARFLNYVGGGGISGGAASLGRLFNLC